ncbi:cytochrome P450 [Lenzites betulinus]|nr:cytochrome P450 [Lenzites betulinus]
MAHTLAPSWTLTVIALFLLLIVATVGRKIRIKLPPGPRGLPVLGNAHQLPSSFAERTFFKWAKKHGDLVYFNVLQTPILLLNTIEVAKDLLDKRSSNYSDRPRMTLQNELLEATTLGSIPYGDRFRKHRKWMSDFMGKKGTLQGYQDIQRREVQNLLQNLYQQPDRFIDHIHLYLASILLEITYGLPVKSVDDKLVRLADRAISGTNEAGRPGAVPVDFLPVLRHIPSWFPGARFKRHDLRVRNDVHVWLDTGYDTVVSAMASGTAAPSVMTSVLTDCGGNPSSDDVDDIKRLAFNVYGGKFAGVETSRGTLAVFMLAMVRNPSVYQRAQEEIDAVVGRDRRPDFTDRGSLPYLDALLEEIYRWRPALPMGVPHQVMADDHYREYDIPGGCMVIPNVWAMSRDTRFYPEPEEFRPERHLDSKEGQKLLPSTFTFGFGRRVCPGQAFADASIWLAAANIISMFDIRKALDEAGNEITLAAEFLSGYTSRPAPFTCRILPRPDTTAAMLQTYGA